MAKGTCPVENCIRPIRCWGLCNTHYNRFKRHGHFELVGQANHYLLHGHNREGLRTRTYRSWVSMKVRCDNPNSNMYQHYGGRGITYDPRWSKFAAFLADMGERPEGRSLDRIDNDGNYEPANCRWATPKEQRANRRR